MEAEADRRRELLAAAHVCGSHGLVHSAKWAAEQAHALLASTATRQAAGSAREMPGPAALFGEHDGEDEYSLWMLGKAYLDTREFDRAAFVLRDAKAHINFFLRW